MNVVHRLQPAIGPLQTILGHLSDIVSHGREAVQRVSDYQLSDGTRFVLHQHELEDLPGVTRDTFDADGPVWLCVEGLVATQPPAVDSDLVLWIGVSDDPNRRPLVRQRATITVDETEKDRLVALGQAHAEHCSQAESGDAAGGLWSVRLRLEQRPDIVERLERYLAGSWATWAAAERPIRRTIDLHRRLRELANVAGRGDCEIVWGLGVSRWRRQGRDLDLPVLERLVEIEVVESAEAEIRVRPRMAGAVVRLGAFEPMTPSAASAGDHAEALLQALGRGSEISPFQPAGFEPVLTAISSHLDPQARYCPGAPGPAHPLPEAGERLMVSDRWVMFARQRSDETLLRDLERLRRAIEYGPKSACCLTTPLNVLLGAPDHDARDMLRQRPSGVIGHPIDVAPAAQAADDQGDLFFPLPTNSDQMEIVRQLRRSDGVVVQGAVGTDRCSAIVNLVCHHLALGLRVLVVSRDEAALANLSGALPGAVRDLTLNLTASDKGALREAELVVGRLLSIVERMDLHEQAEAVNRLERDIVATSQEISRLDDEAAEIVDRSTLRSQGVSDLPVDGLTSLIAERDDYAWFTDRPERFLAETDLLIAAADQARAARLRLGADLKYVDDELPKMATLPDAATLVRLHKDLQATAQGSAEVRDDRLGRAAAAALGPDEADKFASDLDALAAAHRIIAEQPWLAALSPIGARGGERPREAAMVIDFARDASALLARRADVLARPVELPDDNFIDHDLVAAVERLAAGGSTKLLARLSPSGRALKQTVDAIKLAGFAPKTAADWSVVRDHLTWRRHQHSLDARWRSLAPAVGAPALEASHPLQGHERIARSVEIAVVTAALAKRNVSSNAAKLSMRDVDIADLLGDGQRLAALAAAVRTAARRVADQRTELARLKRLFRGCGAIEALVREDVLSQVGRDDIGPREIERRWIAVRTRLRALHERREDVELLDEVCQAMTAAGAGAFARRIRTEPADRDGGDPVLVADWVMAWNWAVLTRQTEVVGQLQRLRDLSDARAALEVRLRELFEEVVVSRTALSLAQNIDSDVMHAFTVFTTTLRKLAATCSGLTASRLREIAREALEGCHDGIPCQLMPTWRVAEQLPSRLGVFDLVIVDDASSSDLRELNAVLRGRKVVVLSDQGRPTLDVLEPGDHGVGRADHVPARSGPVAIRQLLLPGAGLYDLVKSLFPDRIIRLRGQTRRLDSVVLPMTASPLPLLESEPPATVATSAQSPVPAGASVDAEPSVTRPASSIEDEIATVAEGLALARLSAEREPQQSSVIHVAPPSWLSPRSRVSARSGEAQESAHGGAAENWGGPDSPGAPVPLVSTSSEAAGSLTNSDSLHLAEPPATATVLPLRTVSPAASSNPRVPEAETFDRAAPADARRRDALRDLADLPPQAESRRSRSIGTVRRWRARRLMVAAAAVAVMMVGASAYWLSATNRMTTSWQGVFSQLPAFWTGGSTAVALPAGTEPRKVIADRISPDGKGATSDGATSAAELLVSHAVLYQEDPSDPRGKRFMGKVTWRVEPGAGAVPASIKGDIEIDQRMTATLLLRPNVENEMPASHIMEVKFNLPEDASRTGVDTLRGVSMKARESGRGAPLSALTAKVTPTFFMIALSAGDVDTKRNVLLLKGKEWIDIPIVYSGGSRAVLAIEKGADGERAFKDAFAAWGQ
ncbi:helicase [Bradyrhizobium sp. HKCCYLS20291]|uniref:helicase n=1 Tax=Bradyrhizobium sp. HKCCYLS20291 TaxID=3420766 RepID=UPI003EBA5AC9